MPSLLELLNWVRFVATSQLGALCANLSGKAIQCRQVFQALNLKWEIAGNLLEENVKMQIFSSKNISKAKSGSRPIVCFINTRIFGQVIKDQNGLIYHFVTMMKMMLAVEESWFEPDGN